MVVVAELSGLGTQLASVVLGEQAVEVFDSFLKVHEICTVVHHTSANDLMRNEGTKRG